MATSINKMVKDISKYNKFIGSLSLSRAFKKWQKYSQNEEKKDILKT